MGVQYDFAILDFGRCILRPTYGFLTRGCVWLPNKQLSKLQVRGLLLGAVCITRVCAQVGAAKINRRASRVAKCFRASSRSEVIDHVDLCRVQTHSDIKISNDYI